MNVFDGVSAVIWDVQTTWSYARHRHWCRPGCYSLQMNGRQYSAVCDDFGNLVIVL